MYLALGRGGGEGVVARPTVSGFYKNTGTPGTGNSTTPTSSPLQGGGSTGSGGTSGTGGGTGGTGAGGTGGTGAGGTGSGGGSGTTGGGTGSGNTGGGVGGSGSGTVGGGSSTPTNTPPPSNPPISPPGTPTTWHVNIANGGYLPALLSVGPNDVIVFENKDVVSHTVTGNGGKFDSGVIPSGRTFTLNASSLAKGSNPYHCLIHPNMQGSITVQ